MADSYSYYGGMSDAQRAMSPMMNPWLYYGGGGSPVGRMIEDYAGGAPGGNSIPSPFTPIGRAPSADYWYRPWDWSRGLFGGGGDGGGTKQPQTQITEAYLAKMVKEGVPRRMILALQEQGVSQEKIAQVMKSGGKANIGLSNDMIQKYGIKPTDFATVGADGPDSVKDRVWYSENGDLTSKGYTDPYTGQKYPEGTDVGQYWYDWGSGYGAPGTRQYAYGADAQMPPGGSMTPPWNLAGQNARGELPYPGAEIGNRMLSGGDISRYGGYSPVPYPIFMGDSGNPYFDPTQPAYAKSVEEGTIPITQQLPFIQQKSGYASPSDSALNVRLQTPQTSRLQAAGANGLTPVEILNYANERENQLRYYEDMRRQQAIDTMAYGRDFGQKTFDAQMGKAYTKLDQGQARMTNIIDAGQQKGAGILTDAQRGINQNFGEAKGEAYGTLTSGRANQLALANAGRNEVYGILDASQARNRAGIATDRGYVSDLGRQQEARAQQQFQNNIGSMQQSMASRGLGNSTVINSARGVHDRTLNDANLGVAEMRARAMMGLGSEERGLEQAYGSQKAGYGMGFNQMQSQAERDYTNARLGTGLSLASDRRASDAAFAQAQVGNYNDWQRARAGNMTDYNSTLFGSLSGYADANRQANTAYYNNRANMLLGSFTDPNAGIASGYAQSKSGQNPWAAIGMQGAGALAGAIGTGIAGPIGGAIGLGIGSLANTFMNKDQTTGQTNDMYARMLEQRMYGQQPGSIWSNR